MLVTALLFGQAQASVLSPLGEDPANFDQLLETAYLHRDVEFAEAAVAEDLRYMLSPALDGPIWDKDQFVREMRFYEGGERKVEAVRVEVIGDGVQTRGRIHVKGVRPDGPEYQVDFLRRYRRGPAGWQLTSHRTLAQSDRNVSTMSTPPGVFRAGDGVMLPRLLRDVKPQYTSEAMRQQIQGAVLLEAVVNTDGTVGDITVVRSLDRLYGLDEQAIKAAKQWQFTAGTRNGAAVPVLVSIEMAFTLGTK